MKKLKIFFAVYCFLTTFLFGVYMPENTVILVDLDKVVIEGRASVLSCIRHGWSIFWNASNKREILSTYYALFKDRQLLKHWTTELDEATILSRILDRYPALAQHKTQLWTMMGTAQPIEGTLTLLRKLQQAGFTLLPASNIAKEYYDLLIENKVLPNELFKKDFAFTNDHELNKKGVFYCNETACSTYWRKPAVQYYCNVARYLETKGYSKDQYKYMIFMDDKLENILGAAQAQVGIIGIHFQSPQQLEKELDKLLKSNA